MIHINFDIMQSFIDFAGLAVMPGARVTSAQLDEGERHVQDEKFVAEVHPSHLSVNLCLTLKLAHIPRAQSVAARSSHLQDVMTFLFRRLSVSFSC